MFKAILVLSLTFNLLTLSGCTSIKQSLTQEEAIRCKNAFMDGHTVPPGMCYNRYDVWSLERNP